MAESSREENGVARVSVRELVQWVRMSGDIVSGFSPRSRLLEGSAAHRAIQARSGEGYVTEVVLTSRIETEGITTELSGRADAVFDDGNRVIIEEIKSTTRDLGGLSAATHPEYWLQAMCYAFMYLSDRETAPHEVTIRIVYCDPTGTNTRAIDRRCSFGEVESTVTGLIAQYARWASVVGAWTRERDASISVMAFPFPEYRRGQRPMAQDVYRAVRDG